MPAPGQTERRRHYHTVHNNCGEEDVAKCCNDLGIDTSYAKRVSISRLKSGVFDNFWSECV